MKHFSSSLVLSILNFFNAYLTELVIPKNGSVNVPSKSKKMYLETIHVLEKRLSEVKSIDVANELNYSRASVSRAIKLMVEKEYHPNRKRARYR